MPDKTYKNMLDDGYTTYHEDGTRSRTYKNMLDDGVTTYHEDGTKSKTYKNMLDDGVTTYHEDGTRSRTYKNMLDDGYTTYHEDGTRSRTYKNILDNGTTTFNESKSSSGTSGYVFDSSKSAYDYGASLQEYDSAETEAQYGEVSSKNHAVEITPYFHSEYDNIPEWEERDREKIKGHSRYKGLIIAVLLLNIFQAGFAIKLFIDVNHQRQGNLYLSSAQLLFLCFFTLALFIVEKSLVHEYIVMGNYSVGRYEVYRDYSTGAANQGNSIIRMLLFIIFAYSWNHTFNSTDGVWHFVLFILCNAVLAFISMLQSENAVEILNCLVTVVPLCIYSFTRKMDHLSQGYLVLWRVVNGLVLLYLVINIIYFIMGIRETGVQINYRNSCIAGLNKDIDRYDKEQSVIKDSPEYNTTFNGFKAGNGDSINTDIISQYDVNRIKNMARHVAANISKDTDVITIRGIKNGVYRDDGSTGFKIKIDGWVLEHDDYLRTWCKDDPYDTETTLADEYKYWVLEKNGNLAVYEIKYEFDLKGQGAYCYSVGPDYIRHGALFDSSAQSFTQLDFKKKYISEDKPYDDGFIRFRGQDRLNEGASRHYGDAVTSFLQKLEKEYGTTKYKSNEVKASSQTDIDRQDQGTLNSLDTIAINKSLGELGFNHKVSYEEIKEKFYSLSRMYHPTFGKTPDKKKYEKYKAAFDKITSLMGR